MKIRNRIKELRNVQASELRPNPKNWRTHPSVQQDAVRGVLAEIGIADAVLVRELDDGSLMLIDGHLRTEVLSDEVIPCLVLDVDEQEADKLLVTFDPLAELAGKDSEKLSELLSDLQNQGDELSKLVWPDYIIDPLVSADWTPPEVDDSEPLTTGNSKSKSVIFSEEEYETIQLAIGQIREFHEDSTLTDAQCVELVCKEYVEK